MRPRGSRAEPGVAEADDQPVVGLFGERVAKSPGTARIVEQDHQMGGDLGARRPHCVVGHGLPSAHDRLVDGPGLLEIVGLGEHLGQRQAKDGELGSSGDHGTDGVLHLGEAALIASQEEERAAEEGEGVRSVHRVADLEAVLDESFGLVESTGRECNAGAIGGGGPFEPGVAHLASQSGVLADRFGRRAEIVRSLMDEEAVVMAERLHILDPGSTGGRDEAIGQREDLRAPMGMQNVAERGQVVGERRVVADPLGHGYRVAREAFPSLGFLGEVELGREPCHDLRGQGCILRTQSLQGFFE